VSLRMRPQFLPCSGSMLGHGGEVGFEDAGLEKQGGCGNILNFHTLAGVGRGSKCFCTLPSAVLGSLSTRTNARGILKDASEARQRDSSSRSLKSRQQTT
jgi:hypothetical protein